jgi:hypothetical protein
MIEKITVHQDEENLTLPLLVGKINSAAIGWKNDSAPLLALM